MRKYITRALLFFTLIVSLNSCFGSSSSSLSVPSVSISEPSHAPEDYVRILASQVTVNVGETVEVEIDTNIHSPNYSLTNYNAQLVQITLEYQNILVIKGLISGVTTLVVKDEKSGKSDSLKIIINESQQNPGIYDSDIDQIDQIHYLLFFDSEVEVARLVVLPTDTYESLEPYFPTIQERPGYNAYWEKIDYVYHPEQYNVRINAYFEFILD